MHVVQLYPSCLLDKLQTKAAFPELEVEPLVTQEGGLHDHFEETPFTNHFLSHQILESNQSRQFEPITILAPKCSSEMPYQLVRSEDSLVGGVVLEGDALLVPVVQILEL